MLSFENEIPIDSILSLLEFNSNATTLVSSRDETEQEEHQESIEHRHAWIKL